MPCQVTSALVLELNEPPPRNSAAADAVEIADDARLAGPVYVDLGHDQQGTGRCWCLAQMYAQFGVADREREHIAVLGGRGVQNGLRCRFGYP